MFSSSIETEKGLHSEILRRFRKLNDKTIKDSYPLPRIDQTLDKLAGKSWFSTLDFKSGYWQVKIRPEEN